jgi:hypothetical protein
MSFYTEMEDVVVELLTEFGQIIPVNHIASDLTYNPATSGTEDPSQNLPLGSEQSYGVILEWDPNSMIRGGTAEVAGTLIEKSDKRLLIAAKSLTSLKINDTIIANGTSYTVKQPLKEVNPAGRLLLYDCNIRR